MKQKHNTLDMLYTYVSTNFKDIQDKILEDWASEVIENGNHSFEKGLLGLGWLIAFLVENDYIKGDADEILEDIDDTLYKLTIGEVLNPKTEIEQLLCYVTYYQQRLQYKSKAHFYRRFSHFECMKLLLKKLNNFLLETREKTSVSLIRDQINIVLKYSFLVKTCVNEKLVEEAFYPAVEALLNFFRQQEELKGAEEDLAKLYLCVQQYDNPYWIDSIEAICTNAEDYPLKHNEIIPFCWTNICICFPNRILSLDKQVSLSKAERYTLYLYLTNIKQVH
ncbi:hypothetical protein [Sphingobacterium faecale]|uniref:Uncharacterized protein n=1 Tax=Sphingobacterium faecale TaxID=2803775 RepID=A0ABS1R0K6_9SPHI|nr:hypothetical protein [Sphingobacterium faecale]MBL1408203.1 hypothetical protein [Sphingobacterium faecale]